MFGTEVFRGLNGLEAIKADWHLLLARHPQPRFYHFFEWWRAYLSALEPSPNSVHFLLFRDQDGPVVIVPLKHQVLRLLGVPIRELGFPNHPHMPLQDALHRPGTNVHALLVQWFRHTSRKAGLLWDLVRLNGVMSDSPLAFDNANGFEKRTAQACANFDCTQSYEEIFRGFSKNLQASLRKARNRWARETSGRFLILTKPEQIAAQFKDFLRVEASGWKGAAGSGTAIALHADLTRFYEEVIATLAPQGNMRLYCLEVNSEIIAVNLCIVVHDTVYGLKMGYDEKWAKLSPGALLCEHILKDAAAVSSIRHVNCVTYMEWNKPWRPQLYRVYNLVLFNATPVGQLCRLGMKAKQYWKSFRKRKTNSPQVDSIVPDGNPSFN